jgi:hypothetical protein
VARSATRLPLRVEHPQDPPDRHRPHRAAPAPRE